MKENVLILQFLKNIHILRGVYVYYKIYSLPKNSILNFNYINNNNIKFICFYIQIISNCDRLDVLVFKVPVSQRPNAKMRVDQLRYDIRHLQVGSIRIALN